MPRRKKPPANRGTKLDRGFFSRPAEELAPDLLGKILVRRLPDREHRVRLVETEAYVGPHDLACHASKGRTKRTQIMFGPAGFAYVYLIYGMYAMLNIVSGTTGHPEAVLIRAAESLDDAELDLSGPGRLTRALQITVADNGLDLTGEQLYLLSDGKEPPRIRVTKRIGVDYAGAWKDAMLRFVDADTTVVSI